jgi:hypothetical protein
MDDENQVARVIATINGPFGLIRQVSECMHISDAITTAALLRRERLKRPNRSLVWIEDAQVMRLVQNADVVSLA